MLTEDHQYFPFVPRYLGWCHDIVNDAFSQWNISPVVRALTLARLILVLCQRPFLYISQHWQQNERLTGRMRRYKRALNALYLTEEMKTSYSATIWAGCDDSQDYWESNLLCIHCPAAGGGQIPLFVLRLLLFQPGSQPVPVSPIFLGIKTNQAKIYDNDLAPPSSPLLGCVAMV